MKRRVTIPWSAAAWRHRNPQPEYHHVAPIGEKRGFDTGHCEQHGYHVCSICDCVQCGKRKSACSCERRAPDADRDGLWAAYQKMSEAQAAAKPMQDKIGAAVDKLMRQAVLQRQLDCIDAVIKRVDEGR